MLRSLADKSVGAFPRVAIAAFASVLTFACVLAFASCRTAPFYRMTNKASQSLPLSREGVAAYDRGEYELAEEKLRQALELNDCDVDALRYYGETLWILNKRAEAAEALTSAANKECALDTRVAVCRSLSEKSFEMGRPERAYLWADKLVNLSPKDPKGWELRGRASRLMGRNADALLDYQRAVRFSEDERALLPMIAGLQSEMGDLDSALATWQRLETFYPTNREPAEVFVGKGDAYGGLGLLADAQSAYESAVKIEPNEAAHRRRLARTLLARGDVERATSVLAEALRLDPNDPSSRELYVAARQRSEQVAQLRDENATRR